jgi:hypothetical protein
MRLVLQCSVCGTIHTVGTAICGTCRASGIQNLRLLFECQRCFRLGLDPACDVCSHLLSLDEEKPITDLGRGMIAAQMEPHEPSEEILEAILDEELTEEPMLDRHMETGGHLEAHESAFELTLDDLTVPELHEDGPRPDEGKDSGIKDV